MKKFSSVLAKASPEPVIPAIPLREAKPMQRRRPVFGPLIAELFSGARPVRAIAFLSSAPGEGSSYCARLFSEELGEMTAHRAMIVRPGQSPPRCEEVIPIGTVLGADVIGPARHFDICDQVSGAGRFYVVVIDGGAVDSSGALQVVTAVDGVILVVEAGKTTHSQITRAATVIANCGGRLLGVTLNKRTYPIPAWLYRLLP